MLAVCMIAGASTAVASIGPVVGWGDNQHGLLGNDSTGPSEVPVAARLGLPVGVAVTAVATGPNHSLALLSNDTVMAWGENAYGQLGDDGTVSSEVPVSVQLPSLPLGVTVAAISAGANQSLMLLSNGTVFAWGENAYGQLGDGNTSNSAVPVPVCAVGQTLCTPTNDELTGVTAISAGADDALALLSNSTVVAWGENGFGQLGDGSETNRYAPVPVCAVGKSSCSNAGGELTGVAEISAGTTHSLARMSSNSSVVAWGWNLYGQLGDGSTTKSNEPVAVCAVGKHSCTPTNEELTGVTQISAGGFFSLALLSNETAVAWGHNYIGELGDKTDTGPELCAASFPCSEVPVAVSGLSKVTAVSAGGGNGTEAAMALLSNGQVEQWGAVFKNDTQEDIDTPTQVSALQDVASIAAGESDGLAVLKPSPVAEWGNQAGGSLPMPVAFSLPSGVTVKEVATGGDDEEGYLALLSNGTVMSWGRYDLGDGSKGPIESEVPVAVCEEGEPSCTPNHGELTGIAAISAGSGEDVALLNTGKVVAWNGPNASEESNGGYALGDGSAGLEYAPAPVTVCSFGQSSCSRSSGELTGVTTISAGFGYVLARLNNATAVAWGYGTLGDGSGGPADSPVPVAVCAWKQTSCSDTSGALTGVSSVSAGEFSAVATLTDTAMAWGAAAYGDLGDDNNVGPETCDGEACSLAPVPVCAVAAPCTPSSGELTGVAEAAAGFQQGMALLSTGTVVSWGLNFEGELGDGMFKGPQTCTAGIGTLGCSDTPVAVNGLSGVKQIAAEDDTGLALSKTRTVMAWGNNNAGQLGDETLTGPETCEDSGPCSVVPVMVKGLSGVAAISGDASFGAQALVPEPATVVTGTASSLTPSSATLNATVNPNNDAVTNCEFEYSTTKGGPWTKRPCSPFVTDTNTPQPVSVSVSLAANTLYYYRISATNAGGTSEGNEEEFTTLLNSATNATTATDGSLSATGSGGSGTVTVGQYAANPVLAAPLRSAGKYSDVYVATGNSFNKLEFTECGLPTPAAIEWYNPQAPPPGWEPVSDQTTESGGCITATITSGTKPDLAQLTGTIFAVVVPASPPEFGRCVAVGNGNGKYSSSGCTTRGGKDGYEWDTGVATPHFKTKLASGSITLESAVKVSKVTCTGESSGGEYTGVRTVGSMTVTLTGCAHGSEECASTGAAAGEIITRALEGELGVEKTGATNAKNKIGLDLYPAGKSGPVMEFACGSTTVTVQGSVIVPIKPNKMSSTQALKFKAAKGKQKPESFVAGPKDILEESFNSPPFEQTGLTMDITQTNGEPVEVSSVL